MNLLSFCRHLRRRAKCRESEDTEFKFNRMGTGETRTTLVQVPVNVQVSLQQVLYGGRYDSDSSQPEVRTNLILSRNKTFIAKQTTAPPAATHRIARAAGQTAGASLIRSPSPRSTGFADLCIRKRGDFSGRLGVKAESLYFLKAARVSFETVVKPTTVDTLVLVSSCWSRAVQWPLARASQAQDSNARRHPMPGWPGRRGPSSGSLRKTSGG